MNECNLFWAESAFVILLFFVFVFIFWFLVFLYAVCVNRHKSPAHETRLQQVQKDIEGTGTYNLTETELIYGAKLAWRNSSRCIGRIQWSKLQVWEEQKKKKKNKDNKKQLYITHFRQHHQTQTDIDIHITHVRVPVWIYPNEMIQISISFLTSILSHYTHTKKLLRTLWTAHIISKFGIQWQTPSVFSIFLACFFFYIKRYK